ncbi:MAG: FecR family protein [Desulfobacula sp.]|nr:FecR family protein [Desulfobacula sp.]
MILSIPPLKSNESFASESVFDPVGKVVAIRKKAWAIDSKSKKRVLFIKAAIYLHDTIKTTQGRIQIIFKDKTIVTLGKKTQMKITRYIWQPDNPESEMETQINEGSFRIMGGSITKTAPQNFKTNTPSGTIGIRGSMYAGLVKEDFLEIFFQGGKGIVVKNTFGTVELKRPGYMTTIKGILSPPEKPKKADPKRLIEFENTLAQVNEAPLDQEPLDQDSEQTEAHFFNMEKTIVALDDSTTAPLDGLDPIEPLPVTSSIIGNSVIDSTQNNLDKSLDPSTDESKILFSLLNLGFTGQQSTSVPATGISEYKGILENQVLNESPGGIKFIVNWANKKIIAIEDLPFGAKNLGTGFGFGSVTANGGIDNIVVLGSGGFLDNNNIYALTGSETFGHFYGTNTDAIGIAMEGYDINLNNVSDRIFWKDIAAATLASSNNNTYTGQHVWKGFFVGVAEDMADIDTGRRIFTNTTANDFTLTIEKSDGTLSGFMSGSDFNNGANTLNSLSIGGTIGEPEKSVFINDVAMAAKLTGSGSVLTINSNSGDIKTNGNFMVTSGESQLSGHTTWGYWETAFSEPGTGKNYHLHVPGALWIAGEPTSASTISPLIGGTFEGTYAGKAKGIMIDGTGIKTLTNGTTNLFIDFDATDKITGNISFSEKTLTIGAYSGSISTSGFSAAIDGATSSNVDGAFYGSALEGIGGNFSADFSGTQYHGIFAGDK